jgi:hypothetical protein
VPARALFSFVVLVVVMLATNTQMRRAGAAAASGDEPVHKLLMLALDNISRGLCEGKNRCAPATAEERANPPITIAEARLVITRGALSAAAEHCALDWQGRNFVPMMAYWRHTLKKNERQMALIGLLHGITQGIGKGNAKLACTDEMRKNVDRQLTFQAPTRS